MRALCDFALRLTRAPSSIAQADIGGLRSHGWDDAAISDAIQVIAYFNYINRVADGVGIEDEPEWAAVGLSPPGRPAAARGGRRHGA